MHNSTDRQRHILVVDDDEDNRTIVASALRWEGYLVDTAAGGEEALQKLSSQIPHLVLLDVNMPGLSGIDTLKRLRLGPSYVSVILVTAQSATQDVVIGLDAGADDYVRKPFDTQELLARVRTQLRIKDLNDQLKAANHKLQELVDHDDLTGLFNMRNLYEKLDMELARSRRFERTVGAVMMDMDHFKVVNDKHDHLFGSFVLSEVGRLIRENIREVDFAARYGGDEFLIVLGETSPMGAQHFADRLREIIARHHFASGEHEIRLTASMGVAVASAATVSVDARTLVRTADKVLYQAKESGRNCVKLVALASDESIPTATAPASLRGLGRKKSST